jgi:hypothetical protein
LLQSFDSKISAFTQNPKKASSTSQVSQYRPPVAEYLQSFQSPKLRKDNIIRHILIFGSQFVARNTERWLMIIISYSLYSQIFGYIFLGW